MHRSFLVLLLLLGPLVAGAQTPPSPAGSLPRGVFVRVPPPSWNGPASGSKHVTCALRPTDLLAFCFGGDYGDTITNRQHIQLGFGPADASYRQEMYTLDVGKLITGGPDAGWAHIQDYCQSDIAGGVMPKSPDFIGWTWDDKRGGFWHVPGLNFRPGTKVCPGRTADEASNPGYKHERVMFYKPDEPDLAKRWTDVAADSKPHDSWASTYDSVTDTIVRMGYHGGNGGEVHIFDPNTKTWTRKPLERTGTGVLRLMRSLPCADPTGRRMFIGDPWTGRLWRYHMDTRTVTEMAPMPHGRMQDKNEEGTITPDVYVYAAWRRSAGECWVWRNDAKKLLVYESETNTWREIAWTVQTPGTVPAVTHAIFWHPGLDALVMVANIYGGASRGTWLFKP